MSLVARARRAASLAREGLEVVRETQATTAAAAAPRHEDPTGLLPRARAEAAAGLPLAGPSPAGGDDTTGVRWSGGGWELSAVAFHAPDGGPFDARAHWDGLVAPTLGDEAAPVDGLGDEALAHGDAVYVLAGPRLLLAQVTSPEGPERARTIAVALLRDALSSA